MFISQISEYKCVESELELLYDSGISSIDFQTHITKPAVFQCCVYDLVSDRLPGPESSAGRSA